MAHCSTERRYSMKNTFAAVWALIVALLLNIVVPAMAQTNTTPSGWAPPTTNSSPKVFDNGWAPNPPVLTFDVGTILMSKYYGTIFGGTFYDGPMSFTDIAMRWNNGLLKGGMIIDVSIGQKLDRLNKFNQDGGNEYDVSIDQTFKLGGPKYPVLVDIGVTYLALYDLTKLANDAISQTIRLDFPLRADRASGPILQPYIQAYHYNDVGGLKDQGWIGYVGIIRDQPLGFKIFGNEAKLNIDYRMGVNGGVYGSERGVEYHRIALSLPVTWKKWTLVGSIIGQTPGAPGRTYVHKDEIFGTLSVRHPL